jgi:hypothetical protein
MQLTRWVTARVAALEAALGQRKEVNTSKPPKFSAMIALAGKRNSVPAGVRRHRPDDDPTLRNCRKPHASKTFIRMACRRNVAGSSETDLCGDCKTVDFE